MRFGFVHAFQTHKNIQPTLQLVGVLTTFVVGRDGERVWRHTGNITGVLGDARSEIEKAIGAGE
ncbi:MAG: hypothetical protein ABI026_02375 [Gemmatimonadaceae bacterium]